MTRGTESSTQFGPAGPFQAACFGLAGPKSDADRNIRDRPSPVVLDGHSFKDYNYNLSALISSSRLSSSINLKKK